MVHYAASGVSDFSKIKNLVHVQQKLVQAQHTVYSHVGGAYENNYAFVQVPFDEKYYETIAQIADQKKSLGCSAVVFIGIGGSSLGAQAVHLALSGVYWNELNSPKIYWADTLDPQETFNTIKLIEKLLQNNERILLVLVSKSGTTLESIVHYRVFLNLIQKYYASNYHEFIVIITDKNSVLADYARDNNCALITIPEPIGGRYSVFTAVGVFILAFLGYDIFQFRMGACAAVEDVLLQPLELSDAARSALCIYEHYLRGNFVVDYFVFPKIFSGIGLWYRQLLGEGLGKQAGNGDYCHLLPTVSVGSNDLHAVAQLYLGGFPPMFTQFLTCQKYTHDILVPPGPFGSFAQNLTYSRLIDILFQATKNSYDEQKRPYIHIQLPENSIYYIGYLLQFNMIQAVYLATLFDVDSFDQPHVELYKKHVRKMITQ